MSQYLYARRGGPSSYYSWNRGAPGGFRAAETRELSGLGALDVFRAGAPEVLTGTVDDILSSKPKMFALGAATGLALIFFASRKKKRR